MNAKVNVLVLRAAGINCDEEVMHCWRAAGALPKLVHINELTEAPALLDDVSIVTIPGGFSYGDDIGAGQILAQRFLLNLEDPIRSFIARGGGVLGICNGFQVLVKMGLLPGGDAKRDQVTVTYNNSARFEARWVKLEVCTNKCPFLSPATFLEMPVEHAEGRVVTTTDEIATDLLTAGQVAVRYVDESGDHESYPANPNGSVLGIAGLCDATGRVFGLMHHPDRHLAHANHPLWTRSPRTGSPDGLKVFENAVRFWGK